MHSGHMKVKWISPPYFPFFNLEISLVSKFFMNTRRKKLIAQTYNQKIKLNSILP